jgi:hypothetical protein
MSKRKKILLLSILVFPGLLYFFFELSQANFKKMAFYGPKRFNAETKDTNYYSVSVNGFVDGSMQNIMLDTNKYPVFLIGFLPEKYRNEGYKLSGLLDFTQHEPNKLNLIDILLVSSFQIPMTPAPKKPELKIANKDINEVFLPAEKFDSINNLFFVKKPVHVFNYFFALIDKNRNIRGYYDPTYVSEVKRMILEFEHLKLRDEKAKLLRQTTIEQKKEKKTE